MKLYIYLARIMQTLPNNKVDRDPGNGQVCHQFPTDSTNDINARTYIQDFITKKKELLKIERNKKNPEIYNEKKSKLTYFQYCSTGLMVLFSESPYFK